MSHGGHPHGGMNEHSTMATHMQHSTEHHGSQDSHGGHGETGGHVVREISTSYGPKGGRDWQILTSTHFDTSFKNTNKQWNKKEKTEMKGLLIAAFM